MQDEPISRSLLRTFNRLLFRPHKRRRRPTQRVAIVIPLSTRSELTADEQVSLRHLHHYLGHYPRFFLAPEGLPVPFPEPEVKRFAPKFFGSVGAHARMLYWTGFFEAFRDYEFIFFYHLDALAFSDQLLDWCRSDVDYIGPPWLNCPDTPWVTRPRVGNCGFALVRVEAALGALHARYHRYPGLRWLDLLTRNQDRLGPLFRCLQSLQPLFPRSPLIRRPLEEWERTRNPGPHSRNTDVFWSDKAVDYLPSFKVASFELGLQFAFEAAPRTCLELNGGRMPFGCHAWPRYDRAFWEPFLLSEAEAGQPKLVPSGATRA